MPSDFNALSHAEFGKSKECNAFLQSLVTTADHAPNGIAALATLNRPTVLSTSLARAQITEWISAINAAPMIVAAEFITPCLAPLAFEHLVQVGPSIPLPSGSGLDWGG